MFPIIILLILEVFVFIVVNVLFGIIFLIIVMTALFIHKVNPCIITMNQFGNLPCNFPTIPATATSSLRAPIELPESFQ
jgi:hypothetical protein